MKESKPAYAVQTLEQAEAVHVSYVLELYKWNQTQAATALGINRRTLSRMIDRHSLTRKEPEVEPPPEPLEAEALARDMLAMPDVVQCPNCSSELDSPLANGHTLTCTECGHAFPKPGDPHAETAEQ